MLADWLTERGDVRGQLIAWEHQLAVSLGGEPERRALRAQIRALNEAHQEAWLAGWVPPEHARLDWRHGFVIGVTLL